MKPKTESFTCVFHTGHMASPYTTQITWPARIPHRLHGQPVFHTGHMASPYSTQVTWPASIPHRSHAWPARILTTNASSDAVKYANELLQFRLARRLLLSFSTSTMLHGMSNCYYAIS